MKHVIAFGIVSVIAIWSFAAYLFWAPVRLTVTATPPDSVITINGRVASNNELVTLRRGTHFVEVSKDGFTTLQKMVDLKSRKKLSLKMDLVELPVTSKVADNVTTIENGKQENEILGGAKGGAVLQRIDSKTKIVTDLSKVKFGVATKTKWSPDRYLTYLWRADGTSGLVDLTRYDLLNQKFYKWGQGVLDLAWSSDNTEVAYIYKPGNGEFSIISATAGNKKKVRLYDLRKTKLSNNPRIEWTLDKESDKKQLVIIDKDIYIYTFYTHELKQLTKSGAVKFGRLSPDGNTIIYTTNSGLYKLSRTGEEEKISTPVDLFGWMPDGQSLLAYVQGEFHQVYFSGEGKAFGYNGPRIKGVTQLVVNGDYVYYLVNKMVSRLYLQPTEDLIR